MMMHVTRDGDEIPICEMTGLHLQNTIRMIERKAKEGLTIGGGNEGEYWCDQLFGDDALAHLGYLGYVEERERRARVEVD